MNSEGKGLSPAARPCLWGCVALAGLSAVAVAATVALAIFAASRLSNAATDAPLEFERTDYTPAEREAVVQKVAPLETPNAAAQTIVLTSDELNAWLQSDMGPLGAAVAEQARIDLLEEGFQAQFSMPLNGIPFVDGDYLNGTVAGDVFVEGGRIFVTLDALEVGSLAPGGAMLQQMEADINRQLNTDPATQDVLSRITDLYIANGLLHITVLGSEEEYYAH